MESLTYQFLFLVFPILGLIFGSIYVLVGVYSALESYLSRGIMLTILGSIILIPVISIIINIILTKLTSVSNPYFLNQIILSLTSFLVPFIISISLLVIGIYTIVKKRKKRPAEMDQRDIKSPIDNIYR